MDRIIKSCIFVLTIFYVIRYRRLEKKLEILHKARKRKVTDLRDFIESVKHDPFFTCKKESVTFTFLNHTFTYKFRYERLWLHGTVEAGIVKESWRTVVYEDEDYELFFNRYLIQQMVAYKFFPKYADRVYSHYYEEW